MVGVKSFVDGCAQPLMPLVLFIHLRYNPSYLAANLRKPPNNSSFATRFSEEICQIGS
jgi:hypothetical protein